MLPRRKTGDLTRFATARPLARHAGLAAGDDIWQLRRAVNSTWRSACRDTDRSLCWPSPDCTGNGMEAVTHMFSVSTLKYRGVRAQVATNTSNSRGGRHSCSARSFRRRVKATRRRFSWTLF